MLTARPEVTPWQRCTNGTTGGGGRNRTRKLYRSEPDTLCFNAYSSLILQGFKLFFRLLVQRYALPRYRPFIARQVKI